MSAERLQKVLASAGIASRRDCEELIAEGRVSVNGKVMRTLGARVDPAVDTILVDGQPVGQAKPRTYIMLHKPTGVISTAEDTHDRPTVVDLVPSETRLFPIGRLDQNSEGLILLTDDGALAQRLTHPSFEVEKEYRALLDRAPDGEALRQWREGVELEGVPTAPAWVDVQEKTDEGTWVRIVLQEGRKRQIREVAKLLDYEVLRLIRVREGSLTLGDLPAGQWRALTEEEVEGLWQHVGGRPSQQADDIQDEQPPARRPRSDDRPPREGGNFRDRDSFRSRDDRPPREGGFRSRDDRPPREGGFRSRDDRPPREGGFRSRDDRPPREGGFRSRDDRPPREGGNFRDRDTFRSRDDRPPREGGNFRDRDTFRSRDDRPPREGGFRSRDDRPPREGGFRSRDDRPPREGGNFRDRDTFRSRDDRPPREGGFRSRDDRPPREGGFRSRDDRPPREGGFRDRMGGRDTGRSGTAGRPGRPAGRGRIAQRGGNGERRAGPPRPRTRRNDD